MAPINSLNMHDDPICFNSLSDFKIDLAVLMFQQSHSDQIRKKCAAAYLAQTGSHITGEEKPHNPQLADVFNAKRNGLLVDGFYSGSSSKDGVKQRLFDHTYSNCSDIFGSETNRAIQRAECFEVKFREDVVDEETFNEAVGEIGCQYNVNGGAANGGPRLYLIVVHVNKADVEVSCPRVRTPPQRTVANTPPLPTPTPPPLHPHPAYPHNTGPSRNHEEAQRPRVPNPGHPPRGRPPLHGARSQ